MWCVVCVGREGRRAEGNQKGVVVKNPSHPHRHRKGKRVKQKNEPLDFLRKKRGFVW